MPEVTGDPRAASAGSEGAIEHTMSLCQHCHKKVPAELFERDGDIWMRKRCAEHGELEALYWRDATLYRSMSDVVGDYRFCKTFECLDGVECNRCLDKAYNLMLEVTNRCNLDCPVCCSDANNPNSADPSIDQIVSRLPPTRRGLLGKLRRPNVVLFGGEPTVRKDLPDVIRALVERGYIPRLATNGVRLTDDAYLETLWNAGLRWVILQFDGFDDDVSQRLRGERLQKQKMEAIGKLAARGFKVQLGTMMVRGVNTHYAADIIKFVGAHDKLFWMSFYPNASQSRFDAGLKDTHTADMFAEIERTTAGRIRAADFVRSMRVFAWANRLLRAPNLRQKMSTVPIILVFKGDEYFPAVRLLDLRFALRNLDMVAKIALAIPKLLFYQSSYTPPFLKFLVVERFHSEESIDLQEASNCHMSFMTRWSFPPFDLYNIAAKKRGAWEPVEQFRARGGKSLRPETPFVGLATRT
jgi:uncharacterized radical SAM superfamily Fe-S cluster-containing enzyme